MLNLSQEQFVSATAFRYITDAITKEEALEMLESRAATKAEREQRVRETGYPAYVTSAGWLGYDDEKVRRLTKDALDAGFNHFKASNRYLSYDVILILPDESWYQPRIRPPSR
jgi:L-fuconate dehydratase